MPALSAHPRISIDADVALGKPRVTGTRIGVDLILRKLGEGATIEWLLEGYPDLTREDVLAALDYAADHVGRGRARKPIAAE